MASARKDVHAALTLADDPVFASKQGVGALVNLFLTPERCATHVAAAARFVAALCDAVERLNTLVHHVKPTLFEHGCALPVPQVRVVATNVATNVVNEAVSNEAGRYVVGFLQPGTYTLTVEHTGFKKFVREGIVLGVSQRLSLDIALQVGQVTESVSTHQCRSRIRIHGAVHFNSKATVVPANFSGICGIIIRRLTVIIAVVFSEAPVRCGYSRFSHIVSRRDAC
jgi:hypothetical protein